MRKLYFTPMLFIPLISVLLFDTFAYAATLEVGTGKPYAIIQDAINAAVNGDTVLVYDGTYAGHIKFSSKTITVRSVNGAASTIIGGNASGTVVTFEFDEGSVLDGFTITNGSSDAGGGINLYDSFPTIINCTITDNRAYSGYYGGYGGGIYCSDSSPAITNCMISQNTAMSSHGGGNGGGIYCRSCSPKITNTTITGNKASGPDGGEGGGIHYLFSSSPIIINSTITGNTSIFGGGIYCFKSYPTITNCTISGNSVIDNGGGIYGGGSTVKNSILWGNSAMVGEDEIYLSSSTITVTHSDVAGGWTGNGNINADPLFVGIDDYHLSVGSPCIDAGTSEGAPSDDIDCDSRPQGAGYDMGSDEYVATSSTCSIWSNVISKYNLYVSGRAAWADVIECYNQYASPK